MHDPRALPPSPPSSPPYWPSAVNGHESLMMGSLLGELKAGQVRTIYVLELIATKLEELPARLAERIPPPVPPPVSTPPPPPPPPPHHVDRLALKDWMQIVVAVVIIAAAITGKITWGQAFGLVGKPFGF